MSTVFLLPNDQAEHIIRLIKDSEAMSVCNGFTDLVDNVVRNVWIGWNQ